MTAHVPPTATEMAAAIRAGSATPSELVAACLERIARDDGRLRAWVVCDEAGAAALADERSAEAKAGQYRGPLHGVPVGIKDIVDVAGWPTRAGSTVTDDAPVEHDAPLVARLRRAGAIVLGKTVTTEFACFDPPPTRNPWHAERTPGGSSSGSAAAVAAAMCPAAIGSQTGGSIIRPAGFCGVCGLKPTFAAVSTNGVVPVSAHLDHVGPLAASVADLKLLFDVLRDDADRPPAASASDSPAAMRPPRLGVWQEYFLDEADDSVTTCLATALEALRQGGAIIE